MRAKSGFQQIRTRFMGIGFLIAATTVTLPLLVGCEPPTLTRADPPALVDSAFVFDAVWDDGQAEVAFYHVERNRDQYGEPADQQFLVGTYLVKHNYDRARESKAVEAENQVAPAFKYALFYTFESGSYEYKRHWVVNAKRSSLEPLKESFTGFDWCSNRYREFVFSNGTARYLMRSDDYGNADDRIDVRVNTVTPALIPVVVRALDFAERDTLQFSVVRYDGEMSFVNAVNGGRGSVIVAGLETPARLIILHYDRPVPSLIGEDSDTSESYWVSDNAERYLLAVEAESGRYRMELIEVLRSAYWEEDLYPRLERVTERP